jgi:hypothetical protein
LSKSPTAIDPGLNPTATSGDELAGKVKVHSPFSRRMETSLSRTLATAISNSVVRIGGVGGFDSITVLLLLFIQINLKLLISELSAPISVNELGSVKYL